MDLHKTQEHECRRLRRAVGYFAQAMVHKLEQKYRRDGYTGWVNKKFLHHVRWMLGQHARKLVDGKDHTQAVDVANLAMMVWVLTHPCKKNVTDKGTPLPVYTWHGMLAASAGELAVEFGVRSCEKGWNLQRTLEEYRVIVKGE